MSILSSLLIWGLATLNFFNSPKVILAYLATVLITQWLWDHLHLKRPWNWKSAGITGLSLSILLRTDAMWLAVFAAIIAISSKFLLLRDRQHIVNPAAFALVTTGLLFNSAWTSTGQWGHSIEFLLIFSLLGFVVTQQARALSTALLFLGFYSALLAIRLLWLGDPLSILINQLNNGALIIFSFYMITDPRTTPAALGSRVIFCFVVALLAYILQTQFYWYQALFPSLVVVSLVFAVLRSSNPPQGRPPKPVNRPMINITENRS